MRERPILFSGAMVRALLAGTKTQTRRVVKWRDLTPGLNLQFSGLGVHSYVSGLFTLEGQSRNGWESRSAPTRCPYGMPGDRLWVREAWAPQVDCEASERRWTKQGDETGPRPILHFAADGGKPWVSRWRPSIHMPRWASRITLEVTGVRVERLQDISEADAVAEGVSGKHTADAQYTARQAYGVLWEQINGGGSWDANPWVWCVEFKRLTPEKE